MKPDWDKLANKLKDAKKVQAVDVDCTQQQGLCGKHGVKGYPTIQYFTAGSNSGAAYQGGRDFKSLYNFVRQKAAARKKREAKEAEEAVNTQAVLDKLKAVPDSDMGSLFKNWLELNVNEKGIKKFFKSFDEYVSENFQGKQEL